jgi:lipoprotein NlpD
MAGVGATVLGGCTAVPRRDADAYVVESGDTLYSIAWRHDLDYRDLARWNHIGPDFRITVGQRLRLRPDGSPAAAGTSAADPGRPPPRSAGAATARGAGGAPPPAVAPPAAAPAIPGASGTAALKAIRWVWPTDPARARPGDAPRRRPSGGVFFPGRLGQDVRAAAAGRVVYTGSGIRGYGQLVIIKHSDLLLSAYAFNREVLVTEGQEVSTGQTIAHMGPAVDAGNAVRAAAPEAVLYFEIRLNGRTIDPLPFISHVQ